MEQSNKSVTLISAIASLIGAVLFVSILAGVWNYSVVGNILMASGALGLIGAIAGFIARRAERNSLNALGMWLGLALVLALAAFVATYTVDSTTTTIVEPA